jgi:hypothetical protein
MSINSNSNSINSTSNDEFRKENATTTIVDEEQDGRKSGGRPECFSSTVQECLFVLTATMAIGQNSFYTGSITGVTAAIGRELKMNSAEITWINAGAAYV